MAVLKYKDSQGVWHRVIAAIPMTWSDIQGKPSWIGNTKPTYTLAELAGDTMHRVVTDAQISAWNNKQSSLGTGSNGQILAWQNGAPTWIAAPATGVTSFGGQTGAITVRGGQTASGSVNLAMSGTQLQASITGLASVATSGAYGDLSGKPTALSQFTNDSGYITASGSVAKANSLTEQLLLGGTDLNTVTTYGKYYSQDNVTYPNTPTTGLMNFSLEVFQTNQGYAVQRLVRYESGLTYIRTQVYSGGVIVWCSWMSYLPLSGGTMTGDLHLRQIGFGESWNINKAGRSVNPLLSDSAATSGAPDNYCCGYSFTTDLTGFQVASDFSPNNRFWIRGSYDRGDWKNWQELIHSGNIANQSVAYATNAGGILHTNTTDLNVPNWVYEGISYDLFDRNAVNAPYLLNNANGVINVSFGAHGTSGHYGFQLAQTNYTGNFYFREWTGGTPSSWYHLYHSGNANNNSTPWTCSNLTASGNIVASGEITAGSDLRWKHNITPVLGGIDAIMKLQPCTWEWNSDNHKGSGLIAQDVQSVLPHLVKTDGEGFLHLTYDGLHAYEISALQSHETRIQQLERENAELKRQLQLKS